MTNCGYCGAPFDAAARFCVRCGSPRGANQPEPQPVWAPQPPAPYESAPDGFLRIGPTVLPVWLFGLIAALVLGGGGTAAYLLLASPGGNSPVVVAGPADTGSPSATDQGSTDQGSADQGSTDQSSTDGSSDSQTTDTPTPEPTTPPTPSDDPAAVVQQYYADLNAQDFTSAWQLGGDNIAGTSYAQWQSGFGDTQDIQVQATDDASNPGVVDAVITSTQTDGSVQNYSGTYTVSGGVITAADIH
ncbi:zinc ribbon domain-containing protein [Streptacidiphilus melanogenes]|uniref:zinc ribbon domain-containing protein n=1 Tax=Streptacidiphilus melanogenes TaxID=411235 RepID=UPI000694ABC9|nr:zinc ribbon domain-containing protein [Streptacidiphilus melanogenes]